MAWIERLEPDVICFEEVYESETSANTAGWIAEQLASSRHWVFGGHGFGDGMWPDPTVRYGSAVLSRWPIEAHNLFRLPVVDDDDPRLAASPWELLHVRTADLDVFVTHLAPAPNHGLHRRAQVLAIDEHVRTIRGDRDAAPVPGSRRRGMPAILCGDLNAEPESDEVRFLCGFTPIDGRTAFWQDAWAVAGDGGQGLTQDWRTHSLASRLNVHRKRIDYVFVGDPFLRADHAGRVLSATVVCDEPLTGVQASDHMGVLAEIEWPDRPTPA